MKARKTIYQTLNKPKNIVDLAILKLTEKEQRILQNRYGGDLNSPKEANVTPTENQYFYNTIVKKLRQEIELINQQMDQANLLNKKEELIDDKKVETKTIEENNNSQNRMGTENIEEKVDTNKEDKNSLDIDDDIKEDSKEEYDEEELLGLEEIEILMEDSLQENNSKENIEVEEEQTEYLTEDINAENESEKNTKEEISTEENLVEEEILNQEQTEKTLQDHSLQNNSIQREDSKEVSIEEHQEKLSLQETEESSIEDQKTSIEQLPEDTDNELLMLRTPLLEKRMTKLAPKDLVIISLKLGYIDNKFFSTKEISKFLDITEEEINQTTKKVLLSYKEDINQLMNHIISLATEEKIIPDEKENNKLLAKKRLG